MVSLKTERRFPKPGLQGHGGWNTHVEQDDFLKRVERHCKSGKNTIVFESMHPDKLNKAKEVFDKYTYPYFHFMTRNEVKNFVNNKHSNNMFVFVSGKEQDFHIAVHSKSLFIVPTWIPTDDKTRYYGIHVDTPKQLYNLSESLNQ